MTGFPVWLDYQAGPELSAQIREVLDQGRGACVVQNMPCSAENQALEQLALSLGQPLHEAHNLNGGMVCEVRPQPDDTHPAYANTPYFFPCHTDCSDFEHPPNTVLLLCEQPARQGGESLLAHLDDFLPELGFADLLELQRPAFLFRRAFWPILSKQGEQVQIRYNRMMFEIFQRLQNIELDEDQLQALDHLDQAIAAHQVTFALKQGDCLIIDNQRLVHGRTAFETDHSPRLYKRARLHR